MIDTLLLFGWNNLLISGLLACLAWTVQRDGRLPFVAHLLWLLVLAKLLSPPLWDLGMVELPWQTDAAVRADQEVSALLASLQPQDAPGSEVALAEASLLVGSPESTPAFDAASSTQAVSMPTGLKELLLGLWALGSLVILVISSTRILRFHRLLRWGTVSADDTLQAIAADLAADLKLKRVPQVLLSDARLAPLVWAFGGRPRVVLPAHLIEELDPDQLRWVLAHELTHVARRDHLVRWLEWSACVAFWWNPVAWWARRNLRAHEEICCDAQVLRSFGAEPRAYAASLLQVAASLAPPDVRPPAVASAFTDGGELERRFHMILSKNPLARVSRRVQAVLLAGAVVLLPLGIAAAQEPDYQAVQKRLQAAVEAGELSEAQAKTMLIALKKKAGANKDAVNRRLKEAVAAGELTEEQAKAMMKSLDKKPRNSQDLRGGARVIYSETMPTAEWQRRELERERLELTKRYAELEVQQQQFWSETEDKKRKFADIERKLDLLVQHGQLTEAEAEKKLVEVEQQFWPKIEEDKKALEYMLLQERMLELEHRAIEVERLREEAEVLRENLEQSRRLDALHKAEHAEMLRQLEKEQLEFLRRAQQIGAEREAVDPQDPFEAGLPVERTSHPPELHGPLEPVEPKEPSAGWRKVIQEAGEESTLPPKKKESGSWMPVEDPWSTPR